MKNMTTQEVLDELNWTQAKFAKVCGITQPTVHYRAKNNRPLTAEQAVKIQNETGLSVLRTLPTVFSVTAA